MNLFTNEYWKGNNERIDDCGYSYLTSNKEFNDDGKSNKTEQSSKVGVNNY